MIKKDITVLFAASEAEPFVKVGGLADVAGSLPKALKKLPQISHEINVQLCLPYYPRIKANFPNLPQVAELSIQKKGGKLPAQVFQHDQDGMAVYFIDGLPISRDPDIYNLDTSLVGEKFVFFNQALVAMLECDLIVPDILHLNDWHTALVAYLLINRETHIKKKHTLLTLHNLPFMGAGIEASMREYNIQSSDDKELPGWALDLPLPMGLSCVDHIVPVSPNYAREILETEAGCGLNQFLLSRRESITGILNGLDTSIWDPATDKNIDHPFSDDNLESRDLNKERVLTEFELENLKTPLLAIISRMDQQKGIDIAIDSLRAIAGKSWNLILLGSGNPELESLARILMRDYPARVRVINAYDASLSHRLYAGSDVLLMPSRYEPCGLSQMIAMRYGCIPIATDVGGLHDTIVDIRKTSHGTGFLCDTPNSESFANTILQALDLFEEHDRWSDLVRNAMRQDFSWKKSATAYQSIYTQLLNRG